MAKKPTKAKKAGSKTVTKNLTDNAIHSEALEPNPEKEAVSKAKKTPIKGDLLKKVAMPSKEDLVASGRLPPATKHFQQTIEDAEIVEPVSENVMQEEAAPEITDAANEAESQLFQKHSQRGQVALDCIRAVLQGEGTSSDPSDVVDYAFKIGDRLQQRIDNDYKLDQLESFKALATENDFIVPAQKD